MALPVVAVDSLLVAKLFFSNVARPYDRYLNVLKFRCVEAGSGAFAYAPLQTAIMTTVVEEMLTCMFDSTQFVQLRLQVFQLDEAFFEHVVDIPPGTQIGELSEVLVGYAPQMAACFTRRNYLAGRKAIGRTFFGPLSPQYVSDGVLYPDPATAPDIAAVAAAFNAELDAGDAGVWRPCVTSLTNTSETLTADNDQRTGAFSSVISTLRSRRIGSV
jgi:hypothetical protein